MNGIDFIPELERIIRARIVSGSEESYTVRLAASGTRRIAQKVGEEGVEVALAAVAGRREDVIAESADLLYHLLVLLYDKGLGLEDVAGALEERHRP